MFSSPLKSLSDHAVQFHEPGHSGSVRAHDIQLGVGILFDEQAQFPHDHFDMIEFCLRINRVEGEKKPVGIRNRKIIFESRVFADKIGKFIDPIILFRTPDPVDGKNYAQCLLLLPRLNDFSNPVDDLLCKMDVIAGFFLADELAAAVEVQIALHPHGIADGENIRIVQ